MQNLTEDPELDAAIQHAVDLLKSGNYSFYEAVDDTVLEFCVDRKDVIKGLSKRSAKKRGGISNLKQEIMWGHWPT